MSAAEILQGEVWWASLPDPPGSTAGYRRPVIVIQGDDLNRSRLATVICVPLTSKLRWEHAPFNLTIGANDSGLDRDSVAQVALVLAIDRPLLSERVGRLSERQLRQIFHKLDIALGRSPR